MWKHCRWDEQSPWPCFFAARSQVVLLPVSLLPVRNQTVPCHWIASPLSLGIVQKKVTFPTVCQLWRGVAISVLSAGLFALPRWCVTSGTNRAACMCHLHVPLLCRGHGEALGLRTPCSARSSSPQQECPRLQLTLLQAPRTPGSSTAWPGWHLGLLPLRNSFHNTLVCGGCVYPVFYKDSFCFSLSSAVLSVFLMPLPVWPGLSLAPDRNFSINQRFASVAELLWRIIKFTVSN